MQQRIIIGIPGHWKDRRDFITSFTKSNLNKYLFAGEVMQKLDTSEHFQVDIYDADPNLNEAFRFAFEFNYDSPISENEQSLILTQLESHSMTIYVIGEGGTFENAVKIINAVKAVVKAGGIAVKIETTGKAYTAEQWLSITEKPTDLELSIIFSTYIKEGDDYLFSCGLQNIGYKDIIIADKSLKNNAALKLCSVFSAYIIDEKPEISSGQTFSLDDKSKHYEIKQSKTYIYDENDELFFNPKGYWLLEPKTKKIVVDDIVGVASNPSKMKLSKSKFLEYFDVSGLKKLKYLFTLDDDIESLKKRNSTDNIIKSWIEKNEKFNGGCINPALIIDNEQGLIGVYTDLGLNANNSYQVIKILKINPLKLSKLNLPDTALIVTVSLYGGNEESLSQNRWLNFEPDIPQFFIDDMSQYHDAYKSITKEEWKLLKLGYDAVKKVGFEEGIYNFSVSFE